MYYHKIYQLEWTPWSGLGWTRVDWSGGSAGYQPPAIPVYRWLGQGCCFFDSSGLLSQSSLRCTTRYHIFGAMGEGN